MALAIWSSIFFLSLCGSTLVHAQDAAPVEQVPEQPVPEPPAGHTSPPTTDAIAPPSSSTIPALPERYVGDPHLRRRFNIWLGLGIGDAVGCGNEDPSSPCAIDGAVTFALASDFRFHPNFSVGLEIGYWSFAVSDSWRGQISGTPDRDKTSIDASYLAVFGRWYWFDQGIVDPYLQLGFGGGSITATIANDVDSYRYSASGVNTHLGAGVEFHVHPMVKLGPQLLAALLLGGEICEQREGTAEMCRKPEKNDKGEQEGNALAWRFMLVGTVMLGER